MSGLQADNPPEPRANAQVSNIFISKYKYYKHKYKYKYKYKYFIGSFVQVPGKPSDSLGKVPARDKADGAMRLV